MKSLTETRNALIGALRRALTSAPQSERANLATALEEFTLVRTRDRLSQYPVLFKDVLRVMAEVTEARPLTQHERDVAAGKKAALGPPQEASR